VRCDFVFHQHSWNRECSMFKRSAIRRSRADAHSVSKSASVSQRSKITARVADARRLVFTGLAGRVLTCTARRYRSAPGRTRVGAENSVRGLSLEHSAAFGELKRAVSEDSASSARPLI
jgi:hypothetical protein